MTLKKYEKNLGALYLFMPGRIRDYYLLKWGKGEKMMKESSNVVFVQVVERPERKVILKRGKKATNYFEFCEEAGCNIWGVLCSIQDALYEPIGMWMPENLCPAGTSFYTQGVEVPLSYKGEVPEGFEIITLPACKMMIFQGPPYEDDQFMEAIDRLWEQTKNFNPEIYGYQWDDTIAPKFQLAPMGYRGYIEGRPVKLINKD